MVDVADEIEAMGKLEAAKRMLHCGRQAWAALRSARPWPARAAGNRLILTGFLFPRTVLDRFK